MYRERIRTVRSVERTVEFLEDLSEILVLDETGEFDPAASSGIHVESTVGRNEPG